LVQYVHFDSPHLPLVLFPDGSSHPTVEWTSEKIGLRTRAEKPFYDLVIVVVVRLVWQQRSMERLKG